MLLKIKILASLKPTIIAIHGLPALKYIFLLWVIAYRVKNLVISRLISSTYASHEF